MSEDRKTYKRIRKLCLRYGFAEWEVRRARTRWFEAVGATQWTEQDFEDICSNAQSSARTLTTELEERLTPEALASYRQLEDGRRAAYAAEHWPSTDHEPTVPNNEIPEPPTMATGVDFGEDGGATVVTMEKRQDGTFAVVDVQQTPPLRSGSIWTATDEVRAIDGHRVELAPSLVAEDNGELVLFVSDDRDPGACCMAWAQDVIALLERAGLVTRTVKPNELETLNELSFACRTDRAPDQIPNELQGTLREVAHDCLAMARRIKRLKAAKEAALELNSPSYEKTATRIVTEITWPDSGPDRYPETPEEAERLMRAGVHPKRIRTPEGHINNCALANGDTEDKCQVCSGHCPDRAKFGQLQSSEPTKRTTTIGLDGKDPDVLFGLCAELELSDEKRKTFEFGEYWRGEFVVSEDLTFTGRFLKPGE